MKTFLIFATAWLIMMPCTVFSQFGKIPLKALPYEVFTGATVIVVPDSGKTFLYDAPSLFSVKFDGAPIALTSIAKTAVTFVVPALASIGKHTVSVTVNDGPFGEAEFIVKRRIPLDDGTANGKEPDPKKQYGDPISAGKNPTGKDRGGVVINPSGGYGNASPVIYCDSLHKIDGKFTDSIVGSRQEWSGIVPQLGRFSHLYLDYCDKTQTMYLLNDWFLATEEPDSSSCFNLFFFYTANGSILWEIRVYHSLVKGMKVLRNGVDVSKDTSVVVGGKFGFHTSPMFPEKPHPIYEFGIKTPSGQFFFPALTDPVQPSPPSMGTRVICDEATNYGLITDPSYFHGELSSGGVKIQQDARYIPLSGVAGLTTEPTLIGGNLSATSSTMRVIGTTAKTISCLSQHNIDGVFSTFGTVKEWANSTPARGKFSNLYADYCNGVLYILNDWFLGTEEPDKQNCYNLFELFTANGTEHWGIYVYHSVAKGIRVYLNGKDISGDTSMVKGGRFGFDVSPLVSDKKHTIYEFGIKASEGTWNLFLADPGPSSFCDGSNEALPRLLSAEVGVKIQGQSSFQNQLQVSYFDTTRIVFATAHDAGEWGGNRLRATLMYDPALFFPIRASVSSGKSIASSFKYITGKIVQAGTFQIEAETETGFASAGDVFVLEGIPLAGPDSVSMIYGTLEVGNSATYLRRTSIQPLRISAYSANPITRGFVFGGQSNFVALSLSPNPSNGDILSLAMNLREQSAIRMQILDVLGNVVCTVPENIYTAGEQKIGIKAGISQAGAYCLKIISGSEISTIPFIIKD